MHRKYINCVCALFSRTGKENNAGQTILNMAQYLLASQAECISKMEMQYLAGQKNEWMC